MKHYVKLIRMDEWIWSFGSVIFGAFLARSLNANVLFFLLLGFILVGAAIWAMNDVFDYKIDKGVRNNPISSGSIKRRSAAILSIALGLSGLAIARVFLSQSAFLLLATSFGIFLITGHFKLNKNFPGDTIINSVLSVIPFLIGYLAFSALDSKIYVFLTAFILLPIISQLLQQIRDFDSDRKNGLRTFAHVLGLKRSIRAIRIVLLASMAVLLYGIFIYLPPYFFLYILTFIPFLHFAWLNYSGSKKEIFDNGIKAQNLFCILIFIASIIVFPIWITL